MRDDTVAPEPTDSIILAIVAFEQWGLYSSAIIQDVLCYPYQFGMPPGGPTPPLWIKTVNNAGDVPGVNGSPAWQGGGPIGADVCIYVKLVRTTGARNGKHFLRGCLERNDVLAPSLGQVRTYSNAGPPGDTIPGAMQTEADSTLAAFYDGSSPAEGNYLGIVHTHKSGGVIVSATGGKVGGVVIGPVADLQRHKR